MAHYGRLNRALFFGELTSLIVLYHNVTATINIDFKQSNINAVQNAFTGNGEKAILTIQYG